MSFGSLDGAQPANPLGFMKRLSPTVTYYEPTTTTIGSGSGNARAEPELILMSTWMGARENHIAKYVQGYRVIFPTSRILVAQCPFTHVVMPFLAWTQIRPAVPILKEVVDAESREWLKKDDSSVLTGKSTTPRVLIHAFSNGGISTTLFLYNALKRSLGGSFVLPQHVFIFDSCPGTFKWRNTARAIMQILPRWSSPAVHALLFCVWLFYRVVPVLQPRQNVNSRTIRNPRFQEFEVRRTYLYGTADKMIPPTDVEYEAGLAAEAGFHVRLERFEDATHVAIPMSHPERYWRVVEESWYGDELAARLAIESHDGSLANRKADISSETVINNISIVDDEKSISEEAYILVGDIKRNGHETLEPVQQTTHATSEDAQSTLGNISSKAKNITEQSHVVAEQAQSKTEDIMADAHGAVEQDKAAVKQLKANAAGGAKEVEIKAGRKSMTKLSDPVAQILQAATARTDKEAERTTKAAEKSVAASTKRADKKPEEVTETKDRVTETKDRVTETKDRHAERPQTPEASTALQAALAAASSSSREATEGGSSPKRNGGAHEPAVPVGGKAGKSTIKLPEAKTSQAELQKMDESPAAVGQPAVPSAWVEDKAKAERPKAEQPKPTTAASSGSKSKKSKKNGKK
ncbi:hypothetical protein ISF_04707 [Cordyceps fumosorosea ARSEF 2679]|uniref:Indole-diterpene biosynthesis protein PaxU n=1 Tax=Cordyceps fumosorosea (strain ARSEF 2679) TaxID=1081104 RepID=A0A167WN52_CORFA|nr:hypothetical protein ISF_04707 [Cordyceps fumosorosea ARSEF 2679]OAA63998.1 hypothetical protein ISF_04707 [Cordyceps fumosorosea ARSEF 2679]